MMHPLGGDQIHGSRAQQRSAALLLWHKLTEAELLALEGQPERLAQLIEERYGIPFKQADKQVRTFLAKYPP